MARKFRAWRKGARRLGVARALATASAAMVAAAVASCSTDGVMTLRPEVDVGMRTAALPVANVARPDPIPNSPEPTFAMPDIEDEEYGEASAQPSFEPAPPPDQSSVTLAAAVPRVPVARPSATGLQTLVPSNPMMVAYPRLDTPLKPGTALPADEVACRNDLKRLGVTFRDLAPINDGGSCRVDYPVQVSAIGSVTMKPAATLSCSMAASFSRWTRNELVPAARWRYWSGVKTIHQGSSYSCRRIARTTTPSEHSRGNALDVMRIELGNGRDIDVRKPGWFAFREKGFLNTVRADGCDYFTTVLGPGYNYDHRNHFHFDIKPRRNGYVACR